MTLNPTRPTLLEIISLFCFFFFNLIYLSLAYSFVSGCVAFIGVAIYFLSRPAIEVNLQEKLVFAAYFAGAIVCLGFSFAFHTVHCHSQSVGKLFSKSVHSTYTV